MAKIFSVAPAELDTRLKDRSANSNNDSLHNLDSPSSSDESSSSYPTTPTGTLSSDPFATTQFRPLTKSSSTSTSPTKSSDLSKVALSFFLSPTGYRLLRFDNRQRKASKEGTSTTNNNKARKRASVTLSHNSLQRLGSALVGPEEYEQWFKSRTSTFPTNNSDNYTCNKTTPIQRRVTELSSATRAGLRGFLLAFLAGTAMDVLLPSLSKQKFRGLLRKALTTQSSQRLATSCGLFAFVYRLSFHLIALALEHVSSGQDAEEEGWRVGGASKRSDSGIGLGGRGSRARGIVFGGLTQLDHNSNSTNINRGEDSNLHDDQDTDSDNNSDDTPQLSPKELAARNREKWIPAILASLIAAPAYSLIPDRARQLTMALYLLTYAGESAYAAMEHEGLLKWLPSWLGIWILAPISTSSIVHTFIQHSDCSPAAWTKLIMAQCDPFLHKPRGFDTKLLGAFPSSGDLLVGMRGHIGASHFSQPILSTATAVTAALTGESSVKRFLLPEACEGTRQFVQGMGHYSPRCAMYHPGKARCSRAMTQLVGKNFVFSFKMYAVLAALTFVTRGGNVFQKGVMNYVSKTTLSTLRSTIATWGIVVTAFPLYCGMDRILPDWFLPTKRHYLNGFLGGLWVLLETPARQSALTLYFTRFMIESLWRRGVKAGMVRKWKDGRGEVVLFGCAMAVVMGVFETMKADGKKGKGKKVDEAGKGGKKVEERKTIIQSMLNKIFVD